MVRRRDIDSVDRRIFDQRLDTRVRLGDAPAIGECLRLGRVAAADCHDLLAGVPLDRGYKSLGDPPWAKDTPPQCRYG